MMSEEEYSIFVSGRCYKIEINKDLIQYIYTSEISLSKSESTVSSVFVDDWWLPNMNDKSRVKYLYGFANRFSSTKEVSWAVGR